MVAFTSRHGRLTVDRNITFILGSVDFSSLCSVCEEAAFWNGVEKFSLNKAYSKK
jgi:hypothetical protein